MNQQPSEKSIFLEAIEQPSASDRTAYLDAACGDNPKLREEIEVLMRAHDRTGDILDIPNAQDQGRLVQEPSKGTGTSVGRYKLLERIGEGGMGVVYMAEQTQPVQRSRLPPTCRIKPPSRDQEVFTLAAVERNGRRDVDGTAATTERILRP